MHVESLGSVLHYRTTWTISLLTFSFTKMFPNRQQNIDCSAFQACFSVAKRTMRPNFSGCQQVNAQHCRPIETHQPTWYSIPDSLSYVLVHKSLNSNLGMDLVHYFDNLGCGGRKVAPPHSLLFSCLISGQLMLGSHIAFQDSMELLGMGSCRDQT